MQDMFGDWQNGCYGFLQVALLNETCIILYIKGFETKNLTASCSLVQDFNWPAVTCPVFASSVSMVWLGRPPEP